MVNTTIDVSDDLWKVVTIRANRDDITKNEALERILAEYLDDHPKLKEWIGEAKRE